MKHGVFSTDCYKKTAAPAPYIPELAGAYIAYLVVERNIILELKSVQALTPVMEAVLYGWLSLFFSRHSVIISFRKSTLLH